MKIALRGLPRVKLNTFQYTLKHWRTSFTLVDKITLVVIAFLIILTSFKWAQAANQYKNLAPKNGGTFIEGIVGNSLDNIDLGHLTKDGLLMVDEKGNISPNLASSWEVSTDKLTYKFTLVQGVSAYDIQDFLKKNPIYLSYATAAAVAPNIVQFKLAEPNINILSDLSQPIFPYGPYKVDKKSKSEIHLKRNSDYPLSKPYIDKFIIRLYPDQNSLDRAAAKGKVTGAVNLSNIPAGWQQKTVPLTRKHILFINSSKPYLKKTKVRDQILSGQKPDEISSLDVLEVNGEKTDADYEQLKAKLTQAGVELKIRKVALKDALKDDLPRRNYDLLYILANEGYAQDPYLFWNSSQRSGAGQNFSEVASADLDEMTKEYRQTDDKAKREELMGKINELVAKEKVAVEYKNLETVYAVSPKLKGFSVSPVWSSETDRFALVGSWYFFEKRVRQLDK